MADFGLPVSVTPESMVLTMPLYLFADPQQSVSSTNNKINALRKFTQASDSNTLWYKFIVRNSTDYTKEFILRNLLDNVSSKYVPIKFFTEKGDSIFYAKFCLEPVMSYIRQNLTVRVPLNKVLLKLEIEVGTKDEVPDLNINDLVALAVQRRVASSFTALDLSSFHTDPELEAYCFFPLSIFNNLQKVIKCADHFAVTPFTSLDLSRNKIKIIHGCFQEKLTNFMNLRVLKARDNELSMSSMQAITHLPLLDLELDGNPLCELYEKELEYVKDIQGMFPSLKTLDGCPLSSQGIFIVRQFFCKQPSAQPFLEQFLTHYYSIFDSDNRHLLLGLYQSDSTFSLTSTFLPGQSTSTNANLNDYLSESRNILKLCDLTKTDDLLYKGNKQILEFLKKFPKTQHDPTSFTADVLVFEPTHIKISVTGLFREPHNNFASVRFFKRNFVLQYFNKVYLILNDMMFITNCTSEQAVSAFRVKHPEPADPLDLHLTTRSTHIPLSNEQKVKMVEKISDITNMNQEWGRRCLEDVQYDLRNALVYFQKHYEEKSIPSEAFLK
ncbi:nuclear RNA export factor 1-like [Neocloeon triangulifer]|uniref:nuclear RNA export factor 1-like n=1 Tax=Neocloeon triangulifer TaxID=2078957 RepID=UPI00286F7377|nr:nuclear RNA export factor 1-like [Neocloeon triangulifer]XP_059472698.1 nuclear RNA export factor 1-like [Neocloeon triangulifer]